MGLKSAFNLSLVLSLGLPFFSLASHAPVGLMSAFAAAPGASKMLRIGVYFGHSANGLSEAVRKRYLAHLAPLSDLSLLSEISPCTELCQQQDLILDLSRRAWLDPSQTLSEGYQITYARQPRARVTVAGPSLETGAYQVLKKLGYGFWHPLQPVLPERLHLPDQDWQVNSLPHWPVRGMHIHTEHPLELTHVLNGWGLNGPQDRRGWESLLPEWEQYCEWLVANGQNEVEWVLLEKGRWREFSRSAERQQRLKQVVQMAHDWKLKVGIDSPMAMLQQNGWRLITQIGDPVAEKRELQQSLDWLQALGVNFISTEMGQTEFSNGSGQQMLGWLNQATDYLDRRYGMPFYSKVHITGNQTVSDYRDPATGAPLNFNFLPLYGDPRLVLMPHTVQIYSLDDPAPVYGNQNFSHMLHFMELASQQKRQLVWFPEAAYWVNYDNSVPLFLPVYAQRRFHDLHLLRQKGVNLKGQILFSSGWEWGYWLNELLSAVSVWDPVFDLPEAEGLEAILSRELSPLGDLRDQTVRLLLDTMQRQHELLILGQVNGQAPADPRLRNGMAYLSGQDPWSEIAQYSHLLGIRGYQTQPDAIQYLQVARDDELLTRYRQQVRPLLLAMKTEFAQLALRSNPLLQAAPERLKPYLQEINDGLWLNALRSDFVYQLFEAAVEQNLGQSGSRAARLKRADQILEQVQQRVSQRRQSYRSDPRRIADWLPLQATAYRFGYLWRADTLYYWRRERAQFAGQTHLCDANLIDPFEIAFPDPENMPLVSLMRGLLGVIPGWQNCVKPLQLPVGSAAIGQQSLE